MGLSVTAEGVETVDQLARLRGLGCDYAQGLLVGRPQTREEVDAALPEWGALDADAVGDLTAGDGSGDATGELPLHMPPSAATR
jgi:predicted signal transduction protein with EAL and GGDEF domain